MIERRNFEEVDDEIGIRHRYLKEPDPAPVWIEARRFRIHTNDWRRHDLATCVVQAGSGIHKSIFCSRHCSSPASGSSTWSLSLVGLTSGAANPERAQGFRRLLNLDSRTRMPHPASLEKARYAL